MVEVDYRYLWSRLADNAGDVVEAEYDAGDSLDGVRTSLLVLCGRTSWSGWIFLLLASKQGQQRKKRRSPQPRVDGQRIQVTNREILWRSGHCQSCETGDLGDGGRWAVRVHPITDVERPISWEQLG